MIIETTQDIFKVDIPAVIVHQVNCLGYGSMGIMAKVAKIWPDLFKQYHELCGWFKDYDKQNEMMGSLQALPIPRTRLILCNAFSQKFYSDTKYQAIPEAWEKIIRKIISQTKKNYELTKVLYEFHCPAKIGIGMKSEEIDKLKEVVSHYFKDSPMKWVYHI